MLEAGPITSLYVHVPFCAQKCSYCAFFSEPSSGELINRYVEALVRELELLAGDLKPQTVFFGGGTPSLLNLRQWRRILETMERLDLLGAAEWTVECNPATVSVEKAALLREYGVNRISMGVQSLDEALLDRLGRVHSREMVFKSFDILREAGFDNLNLDLMFAVPGQTLEVWRQTLIEALALGSEHLSSYEVIYEEDTALYAQLRAGKFETNEDLACAMYDELVQQAIAAGLQQYEVANFARDRCQPDEAWSPRPTAAGQRPELAAQRAERGADSLPTKGAGAKEIPLTPTPLPPGEGSLPVAQQAAGAMWPSGAGFLPASAATVPGCACLHNVNYWRGGSFYGLGPSATSYVRGVRTKNWSNTQLYCEQLEKGRRAIESSEQLAPLARAGETAAFGLRMTAGWHFEEFRRVTGHELRGEWAGDMQQLAQQGWGRLREDRFQLTPQGLRFADAAAQLFLRSEGG